MWHVRCCKLYNFFSQTTDEEEWSQEVLTKISYTVIWNHKSNIVTPKINFLEACNYPESKSVLKSFLFNGYQHRLWTVCSCHVTYTFQSESTLYSSLNVKKLLARSRREIWRLSDCNWTRTQNHLVLKRTVSLAKWLSVRLRTKWFWFQVQLESLNLQISRLLWTRSSLTFTQL